MRRDLHRRLANVAIHDTKEGLETFRDTILGPRMEAGIDGGFTSHPEEAGF